MDINDIKFSIIMPTYNHGHYIAESIKSVISQSYKNWELVIIDNFSDDDTEKVVTSFNHPQIKYFKFSNKGIIAASRNKGIQKSQGNYICFLDSDDLWLPQKLETVAHFLKKNRYAVLVYHDVLSLKETGIVEKNKRTNFTPKEGFIYEELLMENKIVTLSVTTRKDLLLTHGCFNTHINLKSTEDWDLWIRIAKGNPIYYIPKRLGIYRESPEGISRNPKTIENAYYEILKKHVFNNKNINIFIKKVSLSNFYSKMAFYYRGHRSIRDSLLKIFQGFKAWPLNPKVYLVSLNLFILPMFHKFISKSKLSRQ